MADHDSKSKQVTVPPSAADVGVAEAADRAATDPPAVADKPTSILAALKESTAATEATVEAIRQNTADTATETSRVVEAVKEQAAAATPSLNAPLPAKPAAAVADVIAVVKAAEGVSPVIAKASAVVVADVWAAKRKNAINLIWELTQAFIAISLTLATIVSSFVTKAPEQIPSALTAALGLVVGAYFTRTNHARPTAYMPQGGNDASGASAASTGQRE